MYNGFMTEQRSASKLYPDLPMLILRTFIAQEQPLINAALIEATAKLPGTVIPIARYALGNGGKRLRPLLTILMARLLGYAGQDIYALAAAMEMFHVATLLHDDVMDNADLRRGSKATHKVFGVTETILAGDALLARGNQLVAGFGDPRLSAATSEAIARTADGEILEIANQGKFTEDLSTYTEIISGKTAWMIRASCCIGAAKAGGTEEQIAHAAEYGYNLGMAFQIVDDALDFAPSDLTGKPEGGDVREGKCTPPIFFYADALPPEEREAFRARFAAQSFTEADVRQIIAAVRAGGFDNKTRGIADSYLQKAQKSLTELISGLPAAPYGEILSGFIGYVRDRDA